MFLIDNHASVNLTTPSEKATPLHLVASFSPKDSPSSAHGMAQVAEKLLENGANPDIQDINGKYVN